MEQRCKEECLKIKKQLSLFKFLAEDELCELACYFELKKYNAGEIIWQENDKCDYVAFIVSGRLEIKKETEFKGKQVILGIYSRGSIVGELCVLDAQPRPVTAEALEDVTLVLLYRNNLEKLLEKEPKLGVKLLKGMLQTVSLRLRKSFDRLTTIF